MALFYQINFSTERIEGINKIRWLVCFLILCLLTGAGIFGFYLYEESKKPVLAPRLDAYQTHVTQVTQTLQDWKQAEAGWQEVRTYVEQEDQLAPADMLRALEGLAQMGAQPSSDGCPYAFLPERLEIRREGSIVLTGEASLPEREKVAHCARLAEMVAKQVTNVVASITNAVTAQIFPLAPHALTFEWAKPVPGAEDERLKATLTAAFANGKPLAFKSPPPELEKRLAEAKTWHTKVGQCKLAMASGKKEKVEDLLNRMLSENKKALGDGYERIKAISETAVNPLAVSRAVREALGAKTPGGVAAFEHAWNALAQEKWPWRRVAELDNPALDTSIANLVVWLGEGVLPRKQAFLTIQSRNLAYLNAMTNGVQSQHIENEKKFWEDVLMPNLTVRKELVPKEALPAALDKKDKTSRVAFPLWRAAFDEKSDPQAKKGQVPWLSFEELGTVLMNVETNPAGTWVTAVTVDFDKTQDEPDRRWARLEKVTVEGRVPCWIGAVAQVSADPSKPTPSKPAPSKSAPTSRHP